MINDVIHWLESFTTSPWFYVAIFTVAYLDSIVPIVPGETTVILGGIAAGQGHLSILAVIAIAAGGAFLGDSTSYWLGRKASGPLRRTVFKSEKSRERLAAAERQLDIRGGLLLITARFIPMGRTAVTLSSGITLRPYDWFAKWAAIAGTIWALYAAGLGFLAGEQFEESQAKAFAVAFGTALTFTAIVEIVRWLRNRRTQAQAPA